MTTIRVTNPFLNHTDKNTGSYLDVMVTGDDVLPPGYYDAYCLQPHLNINVNQNYGATVTFDPDSAAFAAAEVIDDDPDVGDKNNNGNTTEFLPPTEEEIAELTWILEQDFVGSGSYTYGQVQVAIWSTVNYDLTTAELQGYWDLLTGGGVTYSAAAAADFMAGVNSLLGELQTAIQAATDAGVTLADTLSPNFQMALLDTAGSAQPVIVPLASLGDTVFFDADASGTFEEGTESGVAGVTVNLLYADGTPVESGTGVAYTTTTDTNGNYSFTALPPGEYKVEFVLPNGYAFTTKSGVAAEDANNDSDADLVTGQTDTITLSSGEYDGDIDAGLVIVSNASLGDYVWVDTNGDGVQNDGANSGLNGVTVNLLDAAGNTVATTTTMDDGAGNAGYYLFDNLAPGTYSVAFVAPGGYTFTTQDQGGDDALDSDANAAGLTVQTTLVSGENDLSWDAGLVPEAPAFEIEKYVRVDENPISLTKFVGFQDPSSGNEGQFLCKLPDGTTNKAESMVFRYTPSTDFDTLQLSDGATGDNAKGGYDRVNNTLDDDSNIFIVVSDVRGATTSADALKGDVYFSGNVLEDDTFTANAVGGSFNNNTYFYFFDEENGDLLQSAYYHMSCSAPIRLGDGILSADLIGYDGTASDLISLEPAAPVYFDANEAPGVGVQIGEEVLFRYEVTNTGDSEISNVTLTDNRLTNVTFVEGDTDGDNNLDTDETWIYSASETALEGLVTNVGIVTGLTPTGQTTVAYDLGNYTGTEVPDGNVGTPGEYLCDTEGKADAILFKYELGETVDTEQDPSKAAILANNGIDDDGTSFIVVTDQRDVHKALNGEGKQFFHGDVAFGETFLADEATADFGAATYIHIFDSSTGGLLQSLTYHTSCSQPIRLGDVVGDVTLVGYDGDKDVDSTLTVLPPEPTAPTDPVPAPDIDALLAGALSSQVDAPFDAGNIGVDGDTAPGAVANIGDIVTFTYEVTNTGTIDLTLNDLVDDNATPGDPSDDFTPTYVQGDVNNDGWLNVGETWYLQAKELATNPGLNTNIVSATASGAGQTIEANDPANYLINPLDVEKLVKVEPIGGGETVYLCDDAVEGKPEAILFKYEPGETIDTEQDPSKAAILANIGIDDDGTSFIVVTDQRDAHKALNGEGRQFFRGDVAIGETFLADEATADFGAATYIHFFDSSAGGLLQSLTYHTSCSQPIRLGDVVGDATLVGYDGDADADTQLTMLPDPVFVDADTVDVAPEAVIGSNVTYQVQVTNHGTEGLTAIDVTDPDLALTLVDNGNGDDILDNGETWIYEGSAEAVKGLQTNEATATASLVSYPDVEVVDTDVANYIGVKPPAPEGDLTELFGKPSAMAFVYTGDTPVIDAGGKDHDGDGLGDQDGKAKIEVKTGTGVDDDDTAYIVVTKYDKIHDIKDGLYKENDKVYFAGEVQKGQAFLADIDFRAEDKFEKDTRIWVFDEKQDFDDENAPLLRVNFKSDDSQPIEYGNIFGSAQLVEYEGVNGMGYDHPEITFAYDTFATPDPWEPSDGVGEAFDLQFVADPDDAWTV